MVRRDLGVLVLAAVIAGCGGGEGTPRPTPTPTTAPPTPTAPAATATPVDTHTPAVTASATSSPSTTAPPSVTLTPTLTLTPTVTLTPTPSPTPVPPEIVLFGVARADDLVQAPDGVDAEGRPIFMRAQGQGMTLFVEARQGSARLQELAYDASGTELPGVELLVSRPLGDGSLAVCDYDPPLIGGVPGIDPPLFSDEPAVRDAIADLGCRFNDGTGAPRARNANSACTRDSGALYSFVDDATTAQFCLPIAKAWAFAPGDTIVAARVRDVRGRVSAAREIVVRVAGEEPFDCEDGLGERVFSAERPASRLVVAGQGDVSVGDWIADPLRICAGPDVGGGVHALTLREDARFGIPLIDGSTLCAKILSRGTVGVLDCEGGIPQDVAVVAEQESGRISVDTGLGLPAGTGAASLQVPTSFLVLPSGSTPGDCFGAQFGAEVPGALTTAAGLAEVRDAAGTAITSLQLRGEPFTCSSWRAGGSPVLVLPIPAAGTRAGDVAAALVLAD